MDCQHQRGWHDQRQVQERLKPQTIWIAQPQEEVSRAQVVKVEIPPNIEFTLDSDTGLRQT